MHRNKIFYALICIDNHVLSCLISMLSTSPPSPFIFFSISQCPLFPASSLLRRRGELLPLFVPFSSLLFSLSLFSLYLLLACVHACAIPLAMEMISAVRGVFPLSLHFSLTLFLSLSPASLSLSLAMEKFLS